VYYGGEKKGRDRERGRDDLEGMENGKDGKGFTWFYIIHFAKFSF